MKDKLKGFVIGIIVTSILLSGYTAFGAGIKKSISVLMNSVSVSIDNYKVDGDNIIYNGNAYIRADKVANILGKDYKWDTKNNIITINENNKISGALLAIKIGNNVYSTSIRVSKDSKGKYYISSHQNLLDLINISYNNFVIRKRSGLSTYYNGILDTVSTNFTSVSLKDEKIIPSDDPRKQSKTEITIYNYDKTKNKVFDGDNSVPIPLFDTLDFYDIKYDSEYDEKNDILILQFPYVNSSTLFIDNTYEDNDIKIQVGDVWASQDNSSIAFTANIMFKNSSLRSSGQFGIFNNINVLSSNVLEFNEFNQMCKVNWFRQINIKNGYEIYFTQNNKTIKFLKKN